MWLQSHDGHIDKATLKLILFEFFYQVLKNSSWKISLQRELAFLPLFNLFIFSWVLPNMEAVQFTSWFDFLFTWASLVSPSYFWTTLEACVQPSFHLRGELPYTIELLLCCPIKKYEYCWTEYMLLLRRFVKRARSVLCQI